MHRVTHLVTSHESDLGNTLRVTELNTDLRGGETLSGELEDLVGDLLRGSLEPRRGSSSVWQGRRGDTLSLGCEGRKVRRDKGSVLVLHVR